MSGRLRFPVLGYYGPSLPFRSRLWRALRMPVLFNVPEGEVLPPGYGMAWLDWPRHRAVAAPMPLNLLLASLRGAWLWAKWDYARWLADVERLRR